MNYDYLSDRELLGILIRETNAGVIDELFMEYEDLPSLLYNASEQDLINIKGVGDRKVAQLLSVRAVIKRLNDYKWMNTCYKITSPSDVNDLLSDMRHLKQEEFKTLLLDTKNQVLEVVTISKGTLNASLVHPREAYAKAITERCASIILAHNHPSGKPEPSREDINITKRLKEVGDIIGIKVLDHIVIGERYYSFKENDLL